MHAGRSSCVHLVSRTPSLILHLQAELKSGAETQCRSSPDWCTSSSWATCRPCRVSRVKTLSEIWKGPPKKYRSGKCSTDNPQDQQAATCEKVTLLPSPDHWFQLQCGQPSPDASLWCECSASWSLGCRHPPLEPIKGRDTCGLIGKCCVMQLLASWNHDTQCLNMSRNEILCVFKYLQSSTVVAAGSDSADRRWTPGRLADCWTSRRQSWSRLPGSETSGQSPGTRDQREEKRRQNRSVHRSD